MKLAVINMLLNLLNYCLFLTVFFVTQHVSLTTSQTTPNSPVNHHNMSNLRDKILEYYFVTRNYKKHERPGEGSAQATVVKVNMKVDSINSINVINMEYSVDMILRQIWYDKRLAWNGSDDFKQYDKSMSIPSKKEALWLPDLFFRNGKKGHVHSLTSPNYLIRLHADGKILFSQKITMNYACQMQLKNFPMDVQRCFINIGSYGYTYEQLVFDWDEGTATNPTITIEPLMEISEFNTQTLNPHICDCSKSSMTATGRYACLKVIFTMKRQLGSYFASSYVTTILIVVTSWLAFFVNIDAFPARVTVGLLTLLGVLTQSSQMAASLPRVSYIKAIDVWIITCIIFVIGALFEFAIATITMKTMKQNAWKKEIRFVVHNELVRLSSYPVNYYSNSAAQHGGRTAGFTNHNSPVSEGSFPEELEALLISQIEDKKAQIPSGGPAIMESKVDVYSRFIFPVFFVFFNACYWIYYLIIAQSPDVPPDKENQC